MKFGKYMDEHVNAQWRNCYVHYKELKTLIKEVKSRQKAVRDVEAAYSPHVTSLTVARERDQVDEKHAQVFKLLESDIHTVGRFAEHQVTQLRARVTKLHSAVTSPVEGAEADRLQLEAKHIGEEFLALEKYVNLNYLAFHKILKKHDKALPEAPCRPLFIARLHQQPWITGNYSDMLVLLSNVHSALRKDTSGVKNEDSSQGFVRSTRKYWCRHEDVTAVKHFILQQLPVFLQRPDDIAAGDAQLVNSAYLDNTSMELYHGRLDKKPGAIAVRMRWYGDGEPRTVFVERKTHRESWKGEVSVKERFTIPEDKVVPFIMGQYRVGDALADLAAKGKSQAEMAKFAVLFEEIQAQVDAKQLQPMIRTQYMRTAFQIPFDPSVRISLDTNLVMMKENPDDMPTCQEDGRWYRDPRVPVHRHELTRFPHAVVEVKLSLPTGTQAPQWVDVLLGSGYLSEVHKFSKFIHGTATLLPDMVRAVPYWMDDESLVHSINASAPSHSHALPITAGANGEAGAGPSSSASQPPPRRAKRPPRMLPRIGLRSRTESEEGDGHQRIPSPAEYSIIQDATDNSSAPDSGSQKSDESGDANRRHPLLGEHPTIRLLKPPEEVLGFDAAAQRAFKASLAQDEESFMEWWFSAERRRAPEWMVKEAQLKPLQMGERGPKTLFAMERTFLQWLHCAFILCAVAGGLAGLGGTLAPPPGTAPPPTAPDHGMLDRMPQVIAMVLVPVGLLMAIYGVGVYFWRKWQLQNGKEIFKLDRWGPLLVMGALIVAQCFIFVVGFIETIVVIRG